MKARDELLEVSYNILPTYAHHPQPHHTPRHVLLTQTLKKETLEELGAFCKSPEYPAFVRKIIVQGLIKIEEDTVEIHCRAEDRNLVAKVVRACYFLWLFFALSTLLSLLPCGGSFWSSPLLTQCCVLLALCICSYRTRSETSSCSWPRRVGRRPPR